MTLRITHTRPASAEEWDQALEACPAATYYHSRNWAELWQEYSGQLEPSPVYVTFGDGVTAVVPVSLRKRYRGLVSVASLSAHNAYGGWLSGPGFTPGHAQSLAGWLLDRYPDLDWRMTPFESPPFDTAGEIQDPTSALDLSGGYDAVEERWKRDHGSMWGAVKQAKKFGVEITQSDRPEHWEAYADAYEESVQRWGESATGVVERRLFEVLRRRASGQETLWVALCDGEVAAGAVCLYAGSHVAYWHGAARADYFSKRPVHLLLVTAIEDACRRGFAWFDFNPSGTHEGVRKFKKSFGAVEKASAVVRRKSRRLAMLERIRGGG